MRMKRFMVMPFGGLFYSAAFGQVQKGAVDLTKIPVPKPHYQVEYTFDVTVDEAKWRTQKGGLHVSFGSTDKLYLRTEVPDLNETSTWKKTGWRGERLNAQILIWSPDTLRQMRFTLNDLVSANGKILSKNHFQLSAVRYILSNYPYGVKDATCGSSPYKNVYLMPDRLEAFERMDVPGKTVRPIWLSLNVPQETEPGVYSGTAEVRTDKDVATLTIKINVQNQVLPKPYDWKHRLDLWQNPWVVARYNQLVPWSAEHKALLKQYLKPYADAGGKYITTYAVHSPWADNSFMIEETMIEWIKQKNGSWKFDYTIFDEYVQLAMEAGIDKAITVYTPIPWGNRFRYLIQVAS